MSTHQREGSLEAPTRHPINWQDAEFYDETALYQELERVFDICHGCRRCFNLCNSFPSLFDLIDESETMELDGVAKQDYWQVVDHCYLCDMCYMTKCPYVPPHEWNVDFPHLMLRAKATRFKQQGAKFRDKLLSSTDTVGKLADWPIIAPIINTVNHNKLSRKVLESTLGIHQQAHIPSYHSFTLSEQVASRTDAIPLKVKATDTTTGKVALFGTCYGQFNEPDLGLDLIRIFEHNQIMIELTSNSQCCGMPKMELGDLQSVQAAKQHNIPLLANYVDKGYDLIAPVPSCVLMFKQELPLLFPDDEQVQKVANAFFDPFEYLMLRHKDALLNTDFVYSLGNVSYHVACHLRVQNIGMKTRDLLELIPNTRVDPIERCSGHDGTYAVKREYHEISMKICKPISNRVAKADPDYYTSDCPMAGQQIGNGLESGQLPTHPLRLLRLAYGL